MGQENKTSKAWNLLLNDEKAFQEFIKIEFEKGRVYFEEEVGQIIKKKIAEKDKQRGQKIPNKQELLILFLEKFRETQSIHGAATLVVDTKYFKDWVKTNNKTFKPKEDSYGRLIPGEITFIYNLATNHFGLVDDIKRYLKMIDSNKYQDLLDEFELGWDETQYRTYE